MTSSPRHSAIQSEITQRWSRTLDYDSPKLADDFFDRGGTSIKALQLLTGIEADLNLTVPLSAFAEQPTLEGLLEILGTSSQ